jgi:pimeloyl-ACP methyl ester carboxylesterase
VTTADRAALPPLHVEEHQGRPLTTVWLHHGVGSTRAWDAFLPAASSGRIAIAYDRRGFGQSPRRREFTPAMFDEDVEDLRALLQARQQDRVHLVGHSDGATVALLLAARASELVASVAVVAVHVRGDDVTVATLRRMGPPTEWPEPMQRSLRRAHGPDWVEVAGGWYALWTSPSWEHWSIAGELPTIRCPVLVVHGLHDDLSPPLHAEAIRSAVPGTRFTWMDTSSHDPHRAEPERFGVDLRRLWEQAERMNG